MAPGLKPLIDRPMLGGNTYCKVLVNAFTNGATMARIQLNGMPRQFSGPRYDYVGMPSEHQLDKRTPGWDLNVAHIVDQRMILGIDGVFRAELPSQSARTMVAR